MFLREAWYVAARSAEVTRRPLARTLLGLDDPTMEQLFSGDMVRVFNEDIPVLEAQQRMREMTPEAPALDIKVDAAPLAARRMLTAMLAHEAAK